MDRIEKVNNMEEKLIEYLGVNEFLNALTRGLSYDTKEYMYCEIYRDYDLNRLEDEE